MSEDKKTLLIIEDDLDVADMLNAYLRAQGYEVLTASWAEDGVKTAKNVRPDLILLDIRLPDFDGYEVAQQLRESQRTATIPIIFLTERNERMDRHRGLSLGADDYITKPFDIQELRIRIRNAIRRAQQDTLTNPITQLPDGRLVDETLTEIMTAGEPWGLLIVSLDNIEFFRESQGFIAADDALRAVSLLIKNIAARIRDPEPFLGHISANQYVLVLEPDRVEGIGEQLRTQIEGSLAYFYPVGLRGSDAEIPNRLTVRIGWLLSTDNPPFKYLDTLKATLVRRLN